MFLALSPSFCPVITEFLPFYVYLLFTESLERIHRLLWPTHVRAELDRAHFAYALLVPLSESRIPAVFLPPTFYFLKSVSLFWLKLPQSFVLFPS